MMSVAAALAVLDGHLVAAGALVTPNIVDVAKGERANLHRRIDYWLDGMAGPERMAGSHATLTDWMIGVGVTVRVYLPVADRAETYAATVETDLYTLAFNIASRVMGDFTLGGNCTAMTVNDIEFGWLSSTGWLRVATIPLVLDFVDQIVIAP
jgi:hypothetical protein